MTANLGSADGVRIEGDEDGFVLLLATDSGDYRVNVHAVLGQLLEEVTREITTYLAEGEAASIGFSVKVPDDLDAYDPNDPKRWGREFQ